ncbi:Glyoxalase/Bleomycin resistance protein/Dihydroxybiphenyl dioxygenase [Xylariaceae sp. FL1272]|nr:Glyoxalase/Bleomycin resistance protein/Dihydroxybiphenyl dioxygenase [Xylariaceae sp. FL1272]
MSGPTSASRTLSPRSMAHVVLRTPNKPTMSTFYQQFLGAHASWEDEHLSFLTYDEEHHRIALLQMPSLKAKDPNTAGLDHFAFTYDTIADLMTAYKQRKVLGILPMWSVNHGPTTSMYYRDPDGNRIETQVDNFDTAEEATGFMSGPAFKLNPIGVDFDPEELIRRLESGESEMELKKRPDVGARGLDDIPFA